MSDRFFLDTNIFVYCFDDSAPKKARRARELVRQAVVTRKGVISYQVVQEFFNLALRRFAEPFSAPEAEQYLATVFRPLLAIHSSYALYAGALRLAARFHLSLYDSLIVAAGLEAECATLYTEDLQHGQHINGMLIRNPFS